MQILPVQWVLIAISLVTGVVLAGIVRTLKTSKLGLEFPIFYRYIGFYIAILVFESVCSVTLCQNYAYFYIFWALTGVTMILEFAVMYELLVNALKPYSALIDLGKMLFRWAAVFLILAALLTAFATAESGGNRLVAAINLLQRSVRLMQCGLLLLFFGFERRLGLSWRTHSMSIALGLGVYAAVDLIFTSYLSVRIPRLIGEFGVLTNTVYLGATSFWAYSLARTEPARKNVLDSPTRLIFQRWNEALVSYGNRGELALAKGSVESFLPGVEQTVERILARKMVQ
ncbi:MAG TPA: hypothetical protein VGN44_05280 [Candidatus Angelobacter sp.]